MPSVFDAFPVFDVDSESDTCFFLSGTSKRPIKMGLGEGRYNNFVTLLKKVSVLIMPK